MANRKVVRLRVTPTAGCTPAERDYLLAVNLGVDAKRLMALVHGIETLRSRSFLLDALAPLAMKASRELAHDLDVLAAEMRERLKASDVLSEVFTRSEPQPPEALARRGDGV